MEQTFSSLRRRELIGAQSGARLGMVDDLLLEGNTVKALLTYGTRPRFLFFRRGNPRAIELGCVRLLGRDFILVEGAADEEKPPPERKKLSAFLEQLFS